MPLYVVTGAAGFIGSNIAGALATQGAEVVACDWLGQDERWRNLAKHDLAGLITPENLPDWLRRNASAVSAVIHMGAVSTTTESDVDLIAARNIRPTFDLLEWCTDAKVRLIYASSAATYGDGARGFDDALEREALAALRPLNAYGWSKLVALRFFNVYGPNEYHKGSMQSVIAKNYARVKGGGSMSLFRSGRPEYPDGGQLRDFIYVRDCVEVVLWLLQHEQVSGLFNLGTGRARTWLDLAHALFDAVERPRQVEFVAMPEMLAAKYQYFTEAKMQRLRSAGYDRPFTSLEAGISDYVRHYLATDDPYR
jgi:ADP-L-glycero-D-manno-heptose 6-epimerase